MRIGFDIGGVISKYPEQFFKFILQLQPYHSGNFTCLITDQHSVEEVYDTLCKNGFDSIFDKEQIFCCDYNTHGEMAKAILIKELELDIFIDDYEGYLQWDSSLGPQPILLKVMPDAYRPYWSPDWVCDGSDFGRRVATRPER